MTRGVQGLDYPRKRDLNVTGPLTFGDIPRPLIQGTNCFISILRPAPGTVQSHTGYPARARYRHILRNDKSHYEIGFSVSDGVSCVANTYDLIFPSDTFCHIPLSTVPKCDKIDLFVAMAPPKLCSYKSEALLAKTLVAVYWIRTRMRRNEISTISLLKLLGIEITSADLPSPPHRAGFGFRLITLSS